MKQGIINILLFAMIIGLGTYVYLDHKPSEHKPPASVKLQQPEFLEKPLSDSVLLEALMYYEVKEPLIVLAQAKLEAGSRYNSRLCLEKNNIFGLYDSQESTYYDFSHWSDAILAYKSKIEYRHREGEDYYHFLKRIKYAKDPKYISKVKRIVSNLPP